MRDRVDGRVGGLSSEAPKITKAGQDFLGEDKAFVMNNMTGQITNLRRERNVWMLALWVRKPADGMDVSSFRRLGR